MSAPVRYALAFDTANEVVAIGVGALVPEGRRIECVASRQIPAHRASNTQLVPRIDDLLGNLGIPRNAIGCVVCGRGPGSFTGVRICIATAKGIASALEAPLLGVSTLDAVAWGAQAAGLRGEALVMADAMRKEVYPVRYTLSDAGIVRQNADMVVKAQAQAESLPPSESLILCGDALAKYAPLLEGKGHMAPQGLWAPQGAGLLLAAQAAWRAGEADPFDARRHDPAFALPVYTRLSDAEENERARLAHEGEAVVPRDLRTGVQHAGREGGDAAARDTLAPGAPEAQPDAGRIVYRPLAAQDAAQMAALEAQAMGSDAWGESLVLDELPRKDRSWWAALSAGTGELVGYAGGLVVDGRLQVLKVAVAPAYRRRGIARSLLARVAQDARDLGAGECTLEVRASNEGAQAAYRALGLSRVGVRPRYYGDREDAVIMEGPLPLSSRDVAGMELQLDQAASASEAVPPAAFHPLILAIETSCDETAAAVIDGDGAILSDVVASQIDFHARFGGVVPEIASRKHVEAICGVAQVCLEDAPRPLCWRDLDAVAVTYAPGLVGALVVGVAFAKGAAWALDVPLVCVNHLEGHLFANRLARPDMAPPMVVSLVSGGHTMLVHVRDWGDYQVLGQTVDDAVGEAFDKVAKALGLGYPGGPVISRLAEAGDPAAIDFPRAMLHSGDLRFSLSGLKTAVVTYIEGERAAGREPSLPDVAASFQAAVVDVQAAKVATALRQTGAREYCIGGGVAANPALRAALQKVCEGLGVRMTMPPASACTDNAAMIALVALDRYRQGRFAGLDADAHAHTDLEQPY